MATYLIVGERSIAGKPPGSTLNDDELATCNIAALIDGGHIAPNQQRAVKAETSEEE